MKIFKIFIVISLILCLFGCKQPEDPNKQTDEGNPIEDKEKEEKSKEEKINELIKKNRYEEAIKLCDDKEINTIILKWVTYLTQNAKTVKQEDIDTFLSYKIDDAVVLDYENTIIIALEKSQYLNENALKVFIKLFNRDGINSENGQDFNDLLIIQTEIARFLGIVPSNFELESYSDNFLSSNKYCELLVKEIEKTNTDKLPSLEIISQVLQKVFTPKMYFTIAQVQRLLKTFNDKGKVLVASEINNILLEKYFSSLIDKDFLLACLGVGNIKESSIYSDIIYKLSDNPSIEILKKYLELVTDDEGNVEDTLLNNTIRKQIEDNSPINYDVACNNLTYTNWTVKKVSERDEYGTGYGIEMAIYGNYVLTITSEPRIGYIRFESTNLKNIIGYENEKYYFIANEVVYSIDRNSYEVKKIVNQKDIMMFEVVNNKLVCLLSDNSIVIYDLKTFTTTNAQFTNWEDITNWVISN